MNTYLTCIAIDDNPLFIRSLKAFIEEIDWLELLETYDESVKGASGIFSIKPDIVFLDIEMPHADGNYLVDWITPRLKSLENPPKIIIVSSLNVEEKDQLEMVSGYINKADLINPEKLESLVRNIVS